MMGGFFVGEAHDLVAAVVDGVVVVLGARRYGKEQEEEELHSFILGTC
jgi:hypothetical protein